MVFGETGSIHISHITVHWPDALTGGPQHTGPSVPLYLLNLEKKEGKLIYFHKT